MSRCKKSLATLMAVCFLSAGTGCTTDVTGELATITGGFVGDVVSTLATGYLRLVLGLEADADEQAAASMHEHEH
ncbi:MAG: hypothetical protein JXQ75_12755 [Phycisphaerae bacterium]|nr:hypothetical protein [Phycisphaerae bacterium]